MENGWRLKQLMNTYTESSGATHVCSGQLLRELREGGSLEGLHRSRIASVVSVSSTKLYNSAFADIINQYYVI